jgi:hypothetical protein
MSNVRNWASAAVVAALILLAPIIAFAVVVMAGLCQGNRIARKRSQPGRKLMAVS